MNPPSIVALRLVTRATRASVRPPFGLADWDPTAAALAVVIDATGTDVGDAAQIASQIPDPTSLPPATPVFVLGTAVRQGAMSRWLGARTVQVTRAARCSALLARGYVGIGAAADAAAGNADLAWAFSSPC